MTDSTPLGLECERGYIPVVDALAGETVADNEAHVTARIALLNLLAHDDTFETFMSHWRQETAVGRAAREAADLLDELARVMGYQHRGELWTADEGVWENESFTITLDDETGLDIDRIHRLPELATCALERMLAAGDSDDVFQVSHSAIELVRDTWQLPWPWLAFEMFEYWLVTTFMDAVGRSVRFNRWWQRPSPLDAPVAPFRFEFESRAGESLGDCCTRFLAQVRSELLPAMEPESRSDDMEVVHSIPAGRTPRTEDIERYISWQYRHRIRGESIRSIARSLPDGNDDKRALVRHGIRRADHWLSVASWGWKEPWER